MSPSHPAPSRPSQVWHLCRLLLYQNKGLLLAPAWVVWVLLFGSQTLVFAVSSLGISYSGQRGYLAMGSLEEAVNLGDALGAALALFCYFLASLGFSTSLAFDDRQDRSVLFWMALPIPTWAWLAAGYLALLLGSLGAAAAVALGSVAFRVWAFCFGWAYGWPLGEVAALVFGTGESLADMLYILPILLLWWLPFFTLFMAAATTPLRSPLVVTLTVIILLGLLEWALRVRILGAETLGDEGFLFRYLAELLEPLTAVGASVVGIGVSYEWSSLLEEGRLDKLLFGLALALASAAVFLHRRRRAAALA